MGTVVIDRKPKMIHWYQKLKNQATISRSIFMVQHLPYYDWDG